MLVCRIVCKPSELILHSFRQCRISYHRILCLLTCEIGIKVGNVQHGFLLSKVKVIINTLKSVRTTLGLKGG